MPVCLMSAAPFRYNEGRLFLCDEVDPMLVKRFSVLSSLAEAGHDSGLGESITLDQFNDWRYVCCRDELATRSVSHRSLCNILQVWSAFRLGLLRPWPASYADAMDQLPHSHFPYRFVWTCFKRALVQLSAASALRCRHRRAGCGRAR